MKLNKTLASTLLLSVALTGCNNMVQNENAKDDNAPVVEENKKDETVEKEETAETAEDKTAEEADKAETQEKATDKEADETKEEAATEDEASDEEATKETADTSNLSTEEKIEALEQAIFDNRSSARAVELLFELSPESANQHADELNELLENSNKLLEQAQTALDELKAE